MTDKEYENILYTIYIASEWWLTMDFNDFIVFAKEREHLDRRVKQIYATGQK